ncbi:MAG: hypothetical protein AB8D52_06710, partial [Gammaproteobacteria bacterium]
MPLKNLLFIIIALLMTLLFVLPRFGVNVTHPSQAAEIAAPQQPIKNIILMIGDGMGLAQVNAARWTAR